MGSASKLLGVLLAVQVVTVVGVGGATPALDTAPGDAHRGASSAVAAETASNGSLAITVDRLPDRIEDGVGATGSVLVENRGDRRVTAVAVVFVEGTPITKRVSGLAPGEGETFSFPMAPAALRENQSIAPGTVDITPGANYTWSVRVGTPRDRETLELDNAYHGSVDVWDADVTRTFHYAGVETPTPVPETAATSPRTETPQGPSDSEGTTAEAEDAVASQGDREIDASGPTDRPERGFFRNGSSSGAVDSFTLTVGGFLLSVVGILHQLFQG